MTPHRTPFIASKMTDRFKIISDPEHVLEYVEFIRSSADNNRSALGFLPAGAYTEAIRKNRLVVALKNDDKGELYAGHLMFGNPFPAIKIVQLFITPQCEGCGVGKKLLEWLTSNAEEKGYMTAQARVATDLTKANGFWESQGFRVVNVVPGGKSTNRTINIRAKEFNSPSLFNGQMPGPETITYPPQRSREAPLFALDINVVLDLIRERLDHQFIGDLVNYALSGVIRLAVTSEFAAELRRHPRNNDPLLAFIAKAPTLQSPPPNELSLLSEQVRAIVFPQRSKNNRTAAQDASDIKHIAISIYFGAEGFITREKKLLAAALQLQSKYGIEVTSAGAISSAIGPSDTQLGVEAANSTPSGKQNFLIQVSQDTKNAELKSFLQTILSDQSLVREFIETKPQESEHVLYQAIAGETLVGVCSWKKISATGRSQLMLAIKRECKEHISLIEHFLEIYQHSLPNNQCTRTDIFIPLSGSQEAMKIFLNAGCRRSGESPMQGMLCFAKIFVPHILYSNTSWVKAAHEIEKLSGFLLPEKLPKHRESTDSGIKIRTGKNNNSIYLPRTEFETLFSPTQLVTSATVGIIIPIKPKYALHLVAPDSCQKELFPVKSPLISHVRTYFRSPKGINSYEVGAPIFFYVSETEKNVIARARILKSEKIHASKIALSEKATGVLTDAERAKMSDQNGYLHMLMFDNVSRLPRNISFAELKSEKLINEANLVSAQKLSHTQLKKIISLAGYAE